MSKNIHVGYGCDRLGIARDLHDSGGDARQMAKPGNKVSGVVVLTLLFGNGVAATVFRILDQISRVQTVLWLKHYLDIFSIPVSIGCIIVGPLVV